MAFEISYQGDSIDVLEAALRECAPNAAFEHEWYVEINYQDERGGPLYVEGFVTELVPENYLVSPPVVMVATVKSDDGETRTGTIVGVRLDMISSLNIP